eukprot:768167-Hanusia_phi.AAC.1
MAGRVALAGGGLVAVSAVLYSMAYGERLPSCCVFVRSHPIFLTVCWSLEVFVDGVSAMLLQGKFCSNFMALRSCLYLREFRRVCFPLLVLLTMSLIPSHMLSHRVLSSN